MTGRGMPHSTFSFAFRLCYIIQHPTNIFPYLIFKLLSYLSLLYPLSLSLFPLLCPLFLFLHSLSTLPSLSFPSFSLYSTLSFFPFILSLLYPLLPFLPSLSHPLCLLPIISLLLSVFTIIFSLLQADPHK